MDVGTITISVNRDVNSFYIGVDPVVFDQIDIISVEVNALVQAGIKGVSWIIDRPNLFVTWIMLGAISVDRKVKEAAVDPVIEIIVLDIWEAQTSLLVERKRGA